MTPDDSDRSLIVTALRMWRNWIQTRDISLSTNDIIASGDKEKKKKVRSLTSEQQNFVVRLETLATSIETGERFNDDLDI